MWDPRALGQANPLPWQTYFVIAQTAAILVLGPSLGLALTIGALEFLAAWSCVRLFETLGVRSLAAAFVAAAFYAFGPVVFTRVAAGQLAYLLAYALLPLIVALAATCVREGRTRPAVGLGVAIGLAGSQIQFLAIAWIAVLPLLPFLARERGWIVRLALAAGIGIAVQLQALLPLPFSSTPALYAGQRALTSFEYNNSAPPADAAIMLGYFTHYYEHHALAGTAIVLYVLAGLVLVAALVAARRFGVYALILVAIGFLFVAGLYGPASVPLAWAFERVTAATAFRDLHYFAALTALGVALAGAIAMDRLRWLALPVAAAAGWIVAPLIAAGELAELVVPRAYVADALDDMRAVAQNGPGRVLWLPAEEPVGVNDPQRSFGRDFTAYGPAGNPSVSDDFYNPQLAYALATLRDGKPDWDALRSMNVRYLVTRSYVRSAREIDNFGTGFQLAYARVGDAQLDALLARDPALRRIRHGALSNVYELSGTLGDAYAATTVPQAVLYPELRAGTVALEPANGAPGADVRASTATADPRADWVAGRFGWRFRPWMAQSIEPFAWTLTGRPLAFAAPAHARCVLAASEFGARLNGVRTIRGPWKPYAIADSPPARTFDVAALRPGGVTAVSTAACVPVDVPARSFVVASAYDAGWRAVDGVRLVPPAWRANGWMMAWPSGAAANARVYVPSVMQALGALLAVLSVGGALAYARREAG